MELVVLCPSYVQGPLLSAASGAISAYLNINLLEHKMPGVLDITFDVVYVRDVAAAQLIAMEKPEAAGNWYILSSEVLTNARNGSDSQPGVPPSGLQGPY